MQFLKAIGWAIDLWFSILALILGVGLVALVIALIAGI